MADSSNDSRCPSFQLDRMMNFSSSAECPPSWLSRTPTHRETVDAVRSIT